MVEVAMRWRVLGPVEVCVDGRVADIRRPQQRAVLALLLLNADRVVPLDHVISALWAEEPPASARTQVQVCMSRIRTALRDAGMSDVLTSDAGGYRLGVADDGLDLTTFAAAVERARAAQAAGRPAEAAESLRHGLALWRGPALAGAAGAFVPAAAAGLEELRLAACEERAAVELSLGHYAAVVEMLRPLVADQPLRETLVGQLMTALAGSGQQAAALRLYSSTRDRLVDELGVEPTAELAGIHLRVLRTEIAAPLRGSVNGAAPPKLVPAQLPTDVAGFTGRSAALSALHELLPSGDGGGPTSVVISAIGGTAGVGKTALAVHFGHRVTHLFPDGQLYVNLRGFDHAGHTVEPGEALLGFLAALDVPPHRIPPDLPSQAALYRSLMAGRRMLVLLDNARDAEQVRPLLPGTPGGLVLITSRRQLTSLVATVGAHPLPLDLMSIVESSELLAGRLGRDRVDREPEAVRAIVDRCARLPLALAIVAARAAATPDRTLTDLAAQLAGPHGSRLAVLEAGDAATDVRAVFSWSYRALEPEAARLFRLLGLHPGPDAGESALASLAGVPPERVRRLVSALVEANLLTEPTPGRYAVHDLLREYAVELGGVVDPEADLSAARHRLFDHYVHVTAVADRLLDPHRLAELVTPAPAVPDVTVDAPADHAAATAWLGREHQVLLAVVVHAAATGFDRHAWQLAAALTTYLDRRGHWSDLADAHTTALTAARRAGDPAGQAQAHRGLAIAHALRGHHEDARRHYERGLALYRETGDPRGLADTHLGLSWVMARQCRYPEAIDESQRALDLYRVVGSRVGQGKALNNLGWLLARIDRHDEALRCCERALARHEESGDRHGAALAWDNLGYVHHKRARHDQAVHCYRRALDLHRVLGDRYDEAEVLANLGDTWQAAGDVHNAQLAWRDALAIFDELGHPDASRLRTALAGLPQLAGAKKR